MSLGLAHSSGSTTIARVCVLVDLLKEMPNRIWLGMGKGAGNESFTSTDLNPSFV